MAIVLTSQHTQMQQLFRCIWTKGWIKLVVGKQSHIVFPSVPSNGATFSGLWEALKAWVWSSLGQSVDKCQLSQDPDLLDTWSEQYEKRAALNVIQRIFILGRFFHQYGKSRSLIWGMCETSDTLLSPVPHTGRPSTFFFPSSVSSWCNDTFVWLQSVIYHKMTVPGVGAEQLKCRSWGCTNHFL